MHSWKVLPDTDIPDGEQQNFSAIVRAALEVGINHFETAHAYGTSEQQLGKVLEDIPRDRYILQTKVMPSADPKKFIRDVNLSLERLQMDRVDLLAIHGINDYRSLWYVCREKGCLAAARSLQKEGKVGAVGFSGHGPKDVILEAVRHEGNQGFDYLNLHWYYIFQENTPVLKEAARREKGVFIISPTDKGGMLQNPADIFSELCQPMQPMEFNDVYCLQRPEISTISIGASRPEDFTAHVAALDLVEAKELIGVIDSRCRKAMHDATGFERPEGLWEKLPPWNETPGLINIPFVLWLDNLARGWGMTGYSRVRYAKLGQETKWVPGNNGAGAGQYDLGPIARKAGLAHDELVTMLEEAHGLLGSGKG